MPTLQQLAAKYGKKDLAKKLRVIGINTVDGSDIVAQFYRENGFTFPSVVGGGWTPGTIAYNYGAQTLPVSYLIDRNGKIVRRFEGSLKGIEKDLSSLGITK